MSFSVSVTAPQIRYLLPFVVDGAGGALFTSLGKILLELYLHFFKARDYLTVNH